MDLALQDVAASRRSRVLAYRWVESALADVAQHAHATSVRIDLKALHGALLQGSVHDDAGALTLAQPPGDAVVNLRNRIEGLGGSVVVRFVPGLGSGRVTTVPAHSDSESDQDPHAVTDEA